METGLHTGASDARLTELLRTSTATAYPALRELRARHQQSVLAYARLCAGGDTSARQLAAQAFTSAARETARGIEPSGPWRHHLLLLTARTAASWATDDRAAALDPGLLLVLNTTGPGGLVPPMTAAFQTLPSRAQGLIWYGPVERQPAPATAQFLGITPEDVAYETDAALHLLGQACLRTRLAASDDPQCGDFRRLIEESVRPDHPRDSADLHAHMAHCPHCTAAHEELSALRDTPRTALAEGLLPWAGTAYTGSEPPQRPKSLAKPSSWPPSKRLVLTSAALGVALAPLLVLLLTQGGTAPSSTSGRAAGAGGTPSSAPQVTVTATVSATPSPSATSGKPSNSPSPTPSSTPTKSKSPSPATPPAHAPNGTYAQVVNVSSGRCLDIRDGDLSKGTDVITAPCSGSRTQRWRVDAGRGVVQSAADPDFCLDNRGDVDKGVGIWECDSVDGDNGDNLTFTVDSDGVIRPAVAILTGVTPEGGDGVGMEPLSGGAEQRWRAGAA
ncbi:ricin-type beta-trefoil lectin domain protein [Streptomyces sp. NPDC092369]|uniref:ricin-type beta-trefoil lectin domain protein n=1 Tax=Streptomyces sp. NPDC092369 TaxID=3366015 RepID=UPI0037F6DA14